MSLQPKRVMWIAAISAVLLVTGAATWIWGNGKSAHAFDREAATATWEIQHRAPAKDLDVDDFVHSLVISGLIVGLGISLVASGTVGLVLSAAIWKREPPPGSILTLRGWKTPEEVGKKSLAAGKAWQAALFGFLAGGPWVVALCTGGLWSSQFPARLAHEFIVILLIECGLFYGLGIRLCRRRDHQQARAAQGSWAFALAVNYGGLVAFLCFIGTVLFLRSHA